MKPHRNPLLKVTKIKFEEEYDIFPADPVYINVGGVRHVSIATGSDTVQDRDRRFFSLVDQGLFSVVLLLIML